MGGDKDYPSLYSDDYEVWKACHSFNLLDGKLTIHAELLTGRTWHGACLLKGKIFVVGGHDHLLQTVDTGEMYDLKKDKWVECFKEMIDDFMESITLVTV